MVNEAPLVDVCFNSKARAARRAVLRLSNSAHACDASVVCTYHHDQHYAHGKSRGGENTYTKHLDVWSTISWARPVPKVV